MDRFEREGREFFERVRSAYLDAAAAAPGRIRLIDASKPIEQVKQMIEENIINT